MVVGWAKHVAIAVAAVVMLAWSGPVAASEPIEEVAPDLFYVEDDAGRLVPVPGFRYRDFVELMRLKDGLPGQPEPPAAVLETIRVMATIPAAPADETTPSRLCDAEIELVIRQTRSGWASLPIDLPGLLVSGPPRHEGPGQVVVTANHDGRRDGPSDGRETDGYRLWLEAPAAPDAARHAVTIKGSLPIEASTTHEIVSLVVPPATASRIEVRTARSDPLVTVRPAGLPPQVSAIEPADDPTARARVVVLGASGPVQIRIGDRRAPAAPIDAVPETNVESLVRIDGTTALVEAVIRLEALPAGTDTVRLRLPAKSTLREVRMPATLVERAGSPEAPEVVVRLENADGGPATVELLCEQAIDSTGAAAFESLGFAVAGVPSWRQRGRVSLVVDGDWQVEWSDESAARRIDPPLSARRPGFVAAFAFDAQPASLPLRVRPRGSRMVIEPEYRYDVSATRVTLDARLRVAVSGAPASRLILDIAGWEVEEVGPASMVDATGVSVQGSRIVIPFSQGLAGEAVIDLRCGRALDRDADRVAWKLPVPQSGLVGPAAVLVVADSEIELVPDTAAIRGLVRQVAAGPVRGDAERLVLAYRLDGSDGQFVAQRRFLPRRVDAAIATKVDLDESTTTVTELLRFTVSHIPLEFIDLLVPEAVERSGTLEIRQGGQLLNPLQDDPLNEETESGVEEDARAEGRDEGDDIEQAVAPRAATRLRALLPVPLLGSGELTITYSLPTPTVPPETTVAEDLLLIMPVDARVGRQSLQVVAAETLAVDVRGEAWKRDAATTATAPGRAWTSPRFQDVVPLALAARRQETTSETVVEAAWLQTRLLPERRDDVYRFAISTAAERLSFVLPRALLASGDTAADAARVEVRLDGLPIESAVRSDGRVSVDLPAGRGRKAYLLEVRGRQPRASTDGRSLLPERVPLEPPQFADGVQQRRFYWEVQFATDEHVVVPPAAWTAQQRWQWGTFGLERVPVVSRSVLDAWVLGNAARPSGGESSLDEPLVGRRAVFSGVGSPGSESMWVAPTWLLVLLASTPTLAWGLMLIYWRTARRVPLVLLVAGALILLTTLRPELAPLLIQAALPGAALAAIAGVLRGVFARPRVAPVWPTVAPQSSLTRVVSQPSIIVAPSVARSADSVTSPGRTAS